MTKPRGRKHWQEKAQAASAAGASSTAPAAAAAAVAMLAEASGVFAAAPDAHAEQDTEPLKQAATTDRDAPGEPQDTLTATVVQLPPAEEEVDASSEGERRDEPAAAEPAAPAPSATVAAQTAEAAASTTAAAGGTDSSGSNAAAPDNDSTGAETEAQAATNARVQSDAAGSDRAAPAAGRREAAGAETGAASPQAANSAPSAEAPEATAALAVLGEGSQPPPQADSAAGVPQVGGASELSSAQEEDGPGTPRHEAGERLPGTPSAAAALVAEQAALQPAAPPAAVVKAPPALSPEQQRRYQQEAEATVAAIAGAAAAVKPFPRERLPVVGTSSALEGRHLDVLAAWLAKFTALTDAQQRVAMERFQPNARFEDNFVLVAGRSRIQPLFYAPWRLLGGAAGGIRLLPEKVEVLPADSAREHATSASTSSGNHSVSELLSSIVPVSLALGQLLPGGNGAPPAAGTYQLRIVTRIAFELWSWKQSSLVVLLFLWPLLLLLPRVAEVWCTDVLTISNADNRVVSYKQRVHNLPTAPWPLR